MFGKSTSSADCLGLTLTGLEMWLYKYGRLRKWLTSKGFLCFSRDPGLLTSKHLVSQTTTFSATPPSTEAAVLNLKSEGHFRFTNPSHMNVPFSLRVWDPCTYVFQRKVCDGVFQIQILFKSFFYWRQSLLDSSGMAFKKSITKVIKTLYATIQEMNDPMTPPSLHPPLPPPLAPEPISSFSFLSVDPGGWWWEQQITSL